MTNQTTPKYIDRLIGWIYFYIWAKPGLFCLFFFFSQDKYSTNLTISDKSIYGLLGTRTCGSRMAGADESTEVWRHPTSRLNIFTSLFISKKQISFGKSLQGGDKIRLGSKDWIYLRCKSQVEKWNKNSKIWVACSVTGSGFFEKFRRQTFSIKYL